jgi:tetratricopeptide (TPR) repeat protein
MTNKAAIHSKIDLLKSQRARFYTAIVIMVSVLTTFAYVSLASLCTNHPFLAFSYMFLLLFFAWLYITPFTYSCLSIFMYKHLSERNYGRIENVFVKAIHILNRLPVPKFAYIPGLLSNLGVARLAQGYYDSAESLFRQALDEAEGLSERQRSWNKERWIPTLAVLYNNLAIACIRQGKHIEAELLLERAVEVCTRVKSGRYDFYLAPILLAMGKVRLELGELSQAKDYIAKAIKQLNSSSKAAGTNEWAKSLDVQSNLLLALTYARCGDFASADPLSKQLLKHNPRVFSTMNMHMLNLLASEYLNHQAYDISEALLELAYSIARDHPFHPDSKQTLHFFEKQLQLTHREAEISEMRSWLRPVLSEAKT